MVGREKIQIMLNGFEDNEDGTSRTKIVDKLG